MTTLDGASSGQGSDVLDRVELRLEDQLCFALYSAANEIVRAYRPLLAKLGLTYPQYLLLLVLWRTNDQTVTEVARQLNLPAHGLLPVIDRLQQAGQLARTRDPADRRVVRLTLTAAGQTLERKAALIQQQVACQTRLSPTALDTLRTQLHDLTQDLSA